MADFDLPVGLQPLADQAVIAADGDGIATEYNIGTLLGPTGARFEIVIAAIGTQGQGALVVVPGQAWDKRAGKRKLPQGCLQKPVCLSVPASDEFDRSVVNTGSSIQAWLGWLGSDQYSSVSFGQEEEHSFKFEDQETGVPCGGQGQVRHSLSSPRRTRRCRHPGSRACGRSSNSGPKAGDEAVKHGEPLAGDLGCSKGKRRYWLCVGALQEGRCLVLQLLPQELRLQKRSPSSSRPQRCELQCIPQPTQVWIQRR